MYTPAAKELRAVIEPVVVSEGGNLGAGAEGMGLLMWPHKTRQFLLRPADLTHHWSIGGRTGDPGSAREDRTQSPPACVVRPALATGLFGAISGDPFGWPLCWSCERVPAPGCYNTGRSQAGCFLRVNRNEPFPVLCHPRGKRTQRLRESTGAQRKRFPVWRWETYDHRRFGRQQEL